MGRPWKIREAAGKSRDTEGKSKAAERAKPKNGETAGESIEAAEKSIEAAGKSSKYCIIKAVTGIEPIKRDTCGSFFHYCKSCTMIITIQTIM